MICYSDTFPRFAVARANFCGNQFVPGLYRLCDVGDLQGLIAPRPLLLEIGLHDTCFLYEDADRRPGPGPPDLPGGRRGRQV